MYALMEFQGKQYKVEKGSLIQVDKVAAEVGSPLNIDSVLLISGENISIGTPYIKGAQVSAVVTEHIKGDKIIVFKYKPKKDYRRTQGHRQQYSMIKIQDIIGV